MMHYFYMTTEPSNLISTNSKENRHMWDSASSTYQTVDHRDFTSALFTLLQ